MRNVCELTNPNGKVKPLEIDCENLRKRSCLVTILFFPVLFWFSVVQISLDTQWCVNWVFPTRSLLIMWLFLRQWGRPYNPPANKEVQWSESHEGYPIFPSLTSSSIHNQRSSYLFWISDIHEFSRNIPLIFYLINPYPENSQEEDMASCYISLTEVLTLCI